MCDFCQRRAGHPARLDCHMMQVLESRTFTFALGILWGIAITNLIKG